MTSPVVCSTTIATPPPSDLDFIVGKKEIFAKGSIDLGVLVHKFPSLVKNVKRKWGFRAFGALGFDVACPLRAQRKARGI